MPRYIIECDDPTDIFLGMRAIKRLIELNKPDTITTFDTGSVWLVKKTKTGDSARPAGKK